MGSQSWTGLRDFYFHKNFRIVCTISFKNAIGISIKIALMTLEFSVYNIMSSASSDSFASFFSIWISFFLFFSCHRRGKGGSSDKISLLGL